MKKILLILVVMALAFGYFVFTKKDAEKNQAVPLTATSSTGSPSATPDITSTPQPAASVQQESNGFKTFTFDNFHGSSEISGKFKFQYPANWYNNGQYFSPQKIQFYDLYTVKAPIYFDLILADIFDQTEFKYQIDTSKRMAPDTAGQIDGRDFKKYELIDSGSYGGDSAGRVKIFVGPKIKIEGDDYYLVFHWEEKPLAESMAGNDLKVFDNMLLTLKFIK